MCPNERFIVLQYIQVSYIIYQSYRPIEFNNGSWKNLSLYRLEITIYDIMFIGVHHWKFQKHDCEIKSSYPKRSTKWADYLVQFRGPRLLGARMEANSFSSAENQNWLASIMTKISGDQYIDNSLLIYPMKIFCRHWPKMASCGENMAIYGLVCLILSINQLNANYFFNETKIL